MAVNWGGAERKSRRVILGCHTRSIALAGVESCSIELGSVDQFLHVLDEKGPELVVHTAGLTNVEACESDPGLARLVNMELAANVAQACARRQIALVHISTDHLFSDDRPLVGEEHPISPVNVYAATKAAAEQEVLSAHPQALVIRTNFFGWGPNYRPSFSDRILNALRRGTHIDLFHDVFFTPILIERLVTAVHDLVASGAHGIYHVVGDERVSKHAFGIALAQAAGLDAELIRSSSIREQRGLVRRPLDMSLSNVKARARLGRKLGPLAEDISRLMQQEDHGLAQEIQSL